MTRASKLLLQDHHEILGGASWSPWAHSAYLPASPRPALSPPHNIRFVTPAADLTGLTQGYSDTSCRALIGQRIAAEAAIGHWGQDVSRHASLRDDSGAGTSLSLNSLGSLWAEAQFWVWQIRKGGHRREGEETRRYSVELLLQPNFTIFHFLFTEMHSIIVSDAEPTCSIPSFLCYMAAQALSRPHDRIF